MTPRSDQNHNGLTDISGLPVGNAHQIEDALQYEESLELSKSAHPPDLEPFVATQVQELWRDVRDFSDSLTHHSMASSTSSAMASITLSQYLEENRVGKMNISPVKPETYLKCSPAPPAFLTNAEDLATELRDLKQISLSMKLSMNYPFMIQAKLFPLQSPSGPNFVAHNASLQLDHIRIGTTREASKDRPTSASTKTRSGATSRPATSRQRSVPSVQRSTPSVQRSVPSTQSKKEGPEEISHYLDGTEKDNFLRKLRPNLTYWLTAANVCNVADLRAEFDTLFAHSFLMLSYLSVVFTTEAEKTTVARNRAVLTGVCSLSNTVELLRQKTGSRSAGFPECLRHFAIVINDELYFQVLELRAVVDGASIRYEPHRLTTGDCTTADHCKSLASWIHHIHSWGMGDWKNHLCEALSIEIPHAQPVLSEGNSPQIDHWRDVA